MMYGFQNKIIHPLPPPAGDIGVDSRVVITVGKGPTQTGIVVDIRGR
jgi:hypothetical protein